MWPLVASFAQAHSGGSVAQGSHTNRTTGVYHCHSDLRPTLLGSPIYCITMFQTVAFVFQSWGFRVCIGVHFPKDVLAAPLVGALASGFSVPLLQRLKALALGAAALARTGPGRWRSLPGPRSACAGCRMPQQTLEPGPASNASIFGGSPARGAAPMPIGNYRGHGWAVEAYW